MAMLTPRPLPPQDPAKLLLLAQRYQRAGAAHALWAEKATECVNFREGRQYTQKQLADLRSAGRPSLVYNEIAPLARLVEGYFSENQVDTIYVPGQDTISNQDTAEALTMVRKQISQRNHEPDVDSDVFLDGLLTGRGFYDLRRSYEKNRLGEAKLTSKDPFRTIIDPEADRYEPDTWGFTVYTPVLSLEEIQATYGVDAATLVGPIVTGQLPSLPIGMMPTELGPVPVRGFGQSDGETAGWQDQYFGLLGDFVDPYRRSIRVLDFEYWVSVPGYVFIDLDTGETKAVPDGWSRDKVQKVLYWANTVEHAHVDVVPENTRKVRWTTIVGDLIVYDAWSNQPHLSTIGFFPYFRRGVTKGMIEDLLDPQRETNKNRGNFTDIINRSANTGWSYGEDSLSPQEERNLKRFGAAPGINIKHRAGKDAPQRIQPGEVPTGFEKLVQEGSSKINDISGISPAALGQVDVVQSGKAYLSRTRQTVIGIQPYFANHKRTKRIVSENTLDLIQNTYTERRIIRVTGEQSKLTQSIVNDEQTDPATGFTSKLNDLTRGQFDVTVDDQPISATFADGQFQEMLGILDRITANPALMQFGDLIIANSSLPDKDDWKKRFQQIQAGMGIGGQPGAAPGAPGMPPQGGGQPQLPPPVQSAPVEPAEPATAEAPSNVIPLAR